ncbi:hypothetical protein [Glutamicibacter sp. TV12E]|uniref:hypothetical protein n=1 Tax=Glutamicibacter sp. TV12E TaxID=3446362 RepID=UPI004034DD4F
MIELSAVAHSGWIALIVMLVVICAGLIIQQRMEKFADLIPQVLLYIEILSDAQKQAFEAENRGKGLRLRLLTGDAAKAYDDWEEADDAAMLSCWKFLLGRDPHGEAWNLRINAYKARAAADRLKVAVADGQYAE